MSQIMEPVKQAMMALVKSFVEGNKGAKKVDAEDADRFLGELIPVFSQFSDFRQKMAGLNEVTAKYPAFSDLEEYLFDLLMLHFIAADAGRLDENYLESDEWEQIEDDTADRGTEWLNLLIYILEAKDEDRKPEIHDFLDEFLLVDDELYQDEFFIYEPVILNSALSDGSVNDIIAAGKKVSSDELKDLFIPMMVYFNSKGSVDERYDALKQSDYNTAMNLAVFAGTTGFEKAL